VSKLSDYEMPTDNKHSGWIYCKI